MDEQRLNKAIKHARIKVIEDISDHFEYPCSESKTYVRPRKVIDYEYTINIGHLSTKDMIAFMNWFREVKPNWLEGLEQGYNDGCSRG